MIAMRSNCVFKLNPLLAGLFCLTLAVTDRAGVVINEIHYDPADETSPEEFIELYNSGAYRWTWAGLISMRE
jgi:hypothetical protein